jgi:RNA polymerase sigma-70 factor (ECF subfamily)
MFARKTNIYDLATQRAQGGKMAGSDFPIRPLNFFVSLPQLFPVQSVVYNVATMAIESDLDLMLRVRDGDAASFETLLRRYRLPLVRYFRRMVRDQGLAEDLAQEVFLRVYKSRERYQPEARFTTWLYRIATNLALNAIRDRRDEASDAAGDDAEGGSGLERFVDPQPTVEQRLVQSDRERLIRHAVEALPGNQRAAVILHKYQEVDYRQIAGILSVSESAVKSLLFRAYETLRVRLEPLLREGQI